MRLMGLDVGLAWTMCTGAFSQFLQSWLGEHFGSLAAGYAVPEFAWEFILTIVLLGVGQAIRNS